ncbi:hypothetical protein V6N12_010353 [Hibiscus sabdariffa]|uniref:Uncharacterized protein n=1 Tax=Hibiscus sabdariffa TaxID=183260 RepID=A0ABR2EJU3_9ROSI
MLDSDKEKLRLVEGKLGKFIENLLEYLDEDEGEEVKSKVIVGNKGDEVEFGNHCNRLQGGRQGAAAAATRGKAGSGCDCGCGSYKGDVSWARTDGLVLRSNPKLSFMA